MEHQYYSFMWVSQHIIFDFLHGINWHNQLIRYVEVAIEWKYSHWFQEFFFRLF